MARIDDEGGVGDGHRHLGDVRRQIQLPRPRRRRRRDRRLRFWGAKTGRRGAEHSGQSLAGCRIGSTMERGGRSIVRVPQVGLGGRVGEWVEAEKPNIFSGALRLTNFFCFSRGKRRKPQFPRAARAIFGTQTSALLL